MDKLLVLVNGLPGSGKSTLGRALGTSLNAQFLSKDAFKEALATCIGDTEPTPELGGIAMDAVWALAQVLPKSVVIDSWWFEPRDLEFAAAGIERAQADHAVEVWCTVPAETAKARYVARRRSPVHRDRQRLADHWETWVAHAAPLGLLPTIVVDTTRPVHCDDLAERIRLIAASPSPTG